MERDAFSDFLAEQLQVTSSARSSASLSKGWSSTLRTGIFGVMPNQGELQPAIRVVMMPKDTNAHGTIFGGVILNYVDQAGVVEASRHCDRKLVTVAMHEVKFIAPVFVGDLVSFYTETVKVGTTSVTVRVTVDAKRGVPPHDPRRISNQALASRLKRGASAQVQYLAGNQVLFAADPGQENHQ